MEPETVASTEVAEDSSGADLAALQDLMKDDAAKDAPAEGKASADLKIETIVAEEPGTDNAPRRARVIKVKRADLEAAIANGALEEYDAPSTASETTQKNGALLGDDEPTGAQPDAPAVQASSLSEEDEAELARELAALEADIAADLPAAKAPEPEQTVIPAPEAAAPNTQPALVEHEAVAEIETPRRANLPQRDVEQGADMNRLLAETDHQMDEPESATRRDAFAHLRAAVAAKKADQAMGAPEREEKSDDAYRNDLAEVVRPRRPQSGAVRTARPADPRPAPLKLVAEQRIDAQEQRPAGPVRPRRVAAVSDSAEQPLDPNAVSFADFAAEMGAVELPQLLEAAAAYMSFVEGREQFSRPQLMTKVRQTSLPEFSREDGLRSFGQLLRAGKIEKIKGGRFTVSDDIGFRPDRRAAG
ncbi:hypothetical protein ACFSUD_05315 [Sulfitobacter aestuarii]|uniref:Lipoprotein n=1 Tax=Sulfitobacter aestuarii TaxID=2161676 RepID=A0ABW5TZC2_9RHOB